MAMAKSIDLAALERRARGALARLRWWDDPELPEEYERPQVYKMLVDGLAGELPARIANSKDFLAAKGAVAAWAAASDLRDRAIELYHDPRIREVAGGEQNLRWLMANPDEAQKALIEHSVEHPGAYRSGPLAEALAVASEATTFHQTYESGPAELPEASPPQSAAVVQPRPGPSREPEQQKPATGSYDELIARPKLTQAEYQQLVSWAEDDVAAESGLPESYFGPKEVGDGEA
jgi:hypothetical protein